MNKFISYTKSIINYFNNYNKHSVILGRWKIKNCNDVLTNYSQKNLKKSARYSGYYIKLPLKADIYKN